MKRTSSFLSGMLLGLAGVWASGCDTVSVDSLDGSSIAADVAPDAEADVEMSDRSPPPPDDRSVPPPDDRPAPPGTDSGMISDGAVTPDAGTDIDARPVDPPDSGPPMRMCNSNADCPARGYCAGMGCGTAGMCAPRPETCVTLFDPVCGCDGRTYSNACAAAGNGVRVERRGECGVMPPADSGVIDGGTPAVCRSDRDCMGGQACCTSSGRCYDARCLACCMPGPVDAGTVDAGPAVCRSDRDCVGGQACCTASGRCYNPACLSCCMPGPVDAGTVDAGPAACRSNSDCGRAQYCAGSGCGTAGTCMTRPTVCTTLYSPVCGCDGSTYSNECTALASGVRPATRGVCAPTVDAGTTDSGVPTACRSDRDCMGGQACCTSSGRCYDTRCLACCMPGPSTDAGTVGSCRTNADCAGTSYCDGTGCDTVGTCVARPTICTREFIPVCGCNRLTYGNACTAAAAGVRVASRSACP